MLVVSDPPDPARFQGLGLKIVGFKKFEAVDRGQDLFVAWANRCSGLGFLAFTGTP